MIPSEAEPRKRKSQQGSGDDVKAVMPEVRVTGGRNVDSSTDGNERKHKKVNRRRGRLVAELDRGGRAMELLRGRIRMTR